LQEGIQEVAMQRGARRWVRVAGVHPGRLQMAALISAAGLHHFPGDVDGYQWWQAAEAVTAASFRAALGAMHSLLAQKLAAPGSNSGSAGEVAPATLPSLARMVAGWLKSWRLLPDLGGPLQRVCPALLLASPDFRADLLHLLASTIEERELADAWMAAAAAALCIDNGSSAGVQAFAADQQLAEALLERLAADAGSGQVGACGGSSECAPARMNEWSRQLPQLCGAWLSLLACQHATSVAAAAIDRRACMAAAASPAVSFESAGAMLNLPAQWLLLCHRHCLQQEPSELALVAWLDAVRILTFMWRGLSERGDAGPAALAADPQRTTDAVHCLLAAATSLGSVGGRPVVPHTITDFARDVVLSYSSCFTQQGRRRILAIQGLPWLLVDRVVHCLEERCSESSLLAHVNAASNYLWMLKLVLEEVPASELQPLTPLQLERMQLLRLLQQHPLHHPTPSGSYIVSCLHPASLDILCRTAKLRGSCQLLQRYWAEVGVGHLQVRCAWPVLLAGGERFWSACDQLPAAAHALSHKIQTHHCMHRCNVFACCAASLQALLAAVAAGPGSGIGGPGDEKATVEWLDNCARCVKAWGGMLDLMAAAAGSSSGAEPLQQLGELGVWRLLAQLAEATGALR
jgi:hypothetical protein